jgi:3-oxosteroid 1-dehydrogenase
MASARVTKWDREADVVVAGSGCAGLTAAILAHDHGTKVVILESSDKLGGATAVSGGGLWVPVNHLMPEKGFPDSREEALTYAKCLTLGRVPDDLVETTVDTAARMARYLEGRTPLKFTLLHTRPIPDYQQHYPGAKTGRCLFAQLFNKKELGEWEDKLRAGTGYDLPIPPYTDVPSCTPHKLPWDVIEGLMAQGMVGGGNALVASLFKGCLDRGILALLETRATALIQEDGRVVGLRAQRNGRDFLVKARGGVILACGGFEWNEGLKANFLPGPITHPASPPTLLGDGLVMAMEAGADLGNMSEVWGCPTVAVPGEEYEGRQLSRICFSERLCPHTMLVNRSGQRFVNEGSNYTDMNKAFQYFDPSAFDYRNIPSWAVFDHQYREKYSFVTVMPGDPDPDWLTVDDTLAGLARKVGIDPDGLQATAVRFNGFAREGKDRDFQRGDSAHDRWWGDQAAPHPNLGTIEKPPFYALPVYPGALGTKGGPKTNARGQVLNIRGQAIPGLYAAGNTMAGVSGPAYWGPGATIGIAMTWGYICGIDAAGKAKGDTA